MGPLQSSTQGVLMSNVTTLRTEFKARNIPEELKAFKRWGVWEPKWREKKQGGGKWEKFPVIPTSQPEKWLEFDQAVSRIKEGDGLGFLLSGIEDIVAFDLDKCLDEIGRPEKWASTLIRKIASYTEISPSGRGLRIFAKGGYDADWQTRDGVNLEVYSGKSNRYVTVTGDVWPGSIPWLTELSQEVLDEVEAQYRVSATVHDLPVTDIPELLSDVTLPLLLDSSARKFMETGECDGDRSGAVQWLATGLINAGLSDQETLSVLVANEFAMDTALDHRRQDYDRAMLYLWKHHVLKARAKVEARPVATINDFDILPDLPPFEREKHEHQQRRRDQQAEAMRIGDGISSVPHADNIQLEEALKRFVYVGDGKGVYDRDNPSHFLDLANFKQFYAASIEHRGKTKVGIPGLWAAHPDRVSVMARSFKAGGGLFITDPEGRKAVNTWRDFDRSGIEIDPTHVEIFVEHVEFIFGKEAKRFLDWLAHIEQEPGELPHTAWLSIATNTGLGRNWISSVLARVWAGRVAANFDLLGMFEKGFNGRLAGKILACVDEIKAGGGEAWPHSEKLKSIVTEETREVNPKYGRQFVEHNSVRWLIFSNHLGAIPLEVNDRRWEVVINENPPKDTDHYAKIYGLIKDQKFIDSVAAYLAARDISKFKPGAHAKANESKQHVINTSKSDIDLACEAIVAEWPSEVIFSSDLSHQVFGVTMDRRANIIKSAMSRVGARPYGKQVKAEGKKERPWILRNIDKWIVAEPFEVSEEGMKGRLRTVLEDPDLAGFH